jgi:hypothetical protein
MCNQRADAVNASAAANIPEGLPAASRKRGRGLTPLTFL